MYHTTNYHTTKEVVVGSYAVQLHIKLSSGHMKWTMQNSVDNAKTLTPSWLAPQRGKHHTTILRKKWWLAPTPCNFISNFRADIWNELCRILLITRKPWRQAGWRLREESIEEVRPYFVLTLSSWPRTLDVQVTVLGLKMSNLQWTLQVQGVY